MDVKMNHKCLGTEKKLTLVRNGIYRFKGIMGTPNEDGSLSWCYPPADYRYLGVAMDYRTRQERIVYMGVGGPDDGNLYVAGLADWLRDFTLVKGV